MFVESILRDALGNESRNIIKRLDEDVRVGEGSKRMYYTFGWVLIIIMEQRRFSVAVGKIFKGTVQG